MPFNANTYRANKYRREAWAYLAEARAIKARVAAGSEWERPRVGTMVKLARNSLRLMRSCLELRRIETRR